MDEDRGIVVHTISFDCDNPAANEFLQELATESGASFRLVWCCLVLSSAVQYCLVLSSAV